MNTDDQHCRSVSNFNMHSLDITAGIGELEGTEADVIEGLVVEDHALVGVLD